MCTLSPNDTRCQESNKTYSNLSLAWVNLDWLVLISTWVSSSGIFTIHLKMSWCFCSLLVLNSHTINLDMDTNEIMDNIIAMVLNGKSWVPKGLRPSSSASSIWKIIKQWFMFSLCILKWNLFWGWFCKSREMNQWW